MHSSECSSLFFLTSHPPQTQVCDCWLSRAPQPKAGTVEELSMPRSEIAGGAPPAPDNVVSLVPNRAIAPSHGEIADRMIQMAERIRSGEFPDMTQAVIMLSDTSRIHSPWVYGQPMTAGSLIGLMEFVKVAIIDETRG